MPVCMVQKSADRCVGPLPYYKVISTAEVWLKLKSMKRQANEISHWKQPGKTLIKN